jgi:hypothetical protein
VGLDTLALAGFGGGKLLSRGMEHVAENTAEVAGRETAEKVLADKTAGVR